MCFGIIKKGILAKGCHASITSYCDCHFQLLILNQDIINVSDIWYDYIYLGFPRVNPNKGLLYIFFVSTRNDNQIATI